jgi:hypothetical protein
MQCARFEQLLPLYAGGDLDAAAVKRTEAHLQSCADCARVAGEYKGVPQLVRLYTAPEFGEDFFDGIRRNVLREIETEAAAPGPAQTISRFFSGTALAFASAAALVITSALILGLYLGGGRRAPEHLQAADSPRPPVAEGLTTTRRTEATPPPAGGGGDIDTSFPAPRQASAQGGGVERKRARPRVKAHAAVAAGGQPSSGATAATTETASGAGPERSPAETPAADGAGRTEMAGAAPQALRIEMQTRDPNVRIIWLVSQQTAAN